MVRFVDLVLALLFLCLAVYAIGAWVVVGLSSFLISLAMFTVAQAKRRKPHKWNRQRLSAPAIDQGPSGEEAPWNV